nr:cadherin repeat domain-containing protein [Burkholderiales bacterium]
LNIGGSTVQANYAAGKGTANLTFTYTILAGQTDANGISFALNSLALNAGSIKDTAGNNATLTHALVADNAAYKVDTAAPTFTSLATASTPENVLTTSAVYTAQATDATGTVSYSLNGTDASKFSINSGTGEVKFITSPDFEAPTDIGLNNVYDINVVATDLAGNASTTAVAITVTNVSEYGSPAGDSVIDLGSYGKLIHPVQVEGKWYYYWDLSGNGTNEDKGELNGGTDRTNGWFLDHTFKYASDFTTVDPYVDIQHPESTNHTYRYAILNGVKLALPTYGGPVDANDRLTSAGHLVPTAVSSGTVNNSTYNDLAAIWDAFNGSSTTDNTDGLPTGWADNAYYLSATELNGRGTHAAVGLGTGGYVTSFAEYATSLEPNHTGKMWVALQVL